MNPDQTPSLGTVKRVPCPTCGGDSIFAPSNEFRPFCSARCKNVDLGAWANEDFRMATGVPSEDQITDDDQNL